MHCGALPKITMSKTSTFVSESLLLAEGVPVPPSGRYPSDRRTQGPHR